VSVFLIYISEEANIQNASYKSNADDHRNRLTG
jgi:hypothetical protein